MGHRQYFPLSQRFDYYEDTWNLPYHGPPLCLGTSATGTDCIPYYDTEPRPNNILYHNPRDNYPSYASSSNPIPPTYYEEGPYYNGHANNSHMDCEREQFKRKSPAIPSDNLQPNPTSGSRYWACEPNSMHLGYKENSLASGEVSQRNIRRRQNFAIRLENNNNSGAPHHFHPTSNCSGFTDDGVWGPTHASMEYHRRFLSSGDGCFNPEMNHFFARRNNTNNSMDIDGGCHYNLHNRNYNNPFPNAGYSYYPRRNYTCGATSSYQSAECMAPSNDGRGERFEAAAPCTHSRPLYIHPSSERIGRSRGLHDRSQRFSYENTHETEWASEVQSPFYDSRNLFDEHRDMRLDIDNMGYEELLALGERIGNVSTGLSGDAISRCLVEARHISNHITMNEERKCSICLEEYKDKDAVGRLACRHEYHSICIKKWLSIKNMCPVCKAAASSDT